MEKKWKIGFTSSFHSWGLSGHVGPATPTRMSAWPCRPVAPCTGCTQAVPLGF